MRFILLAAAALSASSSTIARPPASPVPAPTLQALAPSAMPVRLRDKDCQNPNIYHAAPKPGVREPAEVRRLDKLPSGALILAVERNITGCRELTIVNYGYGGVRQAEPQRPARR